MIFENTVFINVDVIEFGNPNNLLNEIRPNYLINFQWVPQTICDSVWMFFEFKNLDDKVRFIESISSLTYISAWDGRTKNVIELLSNNFDQEKLDYWCNGQDYNP